MKKLRVGIVGGGASGLIAAIKAAECAEVTIIEKNEAAGKKILSTGNGKCNLSNTDFETNKYYCSDYQKLESIFNDFSVKDTLSFFENLGLLVKDKNGYIYPVNEQAKTVADILTAACRMRGVAMETGCEVSDIKVEGDGFRLSAKSCAAGNNHSSQSGLKKEFRFDRVILACGSPAGLKNVKSHNGLYLSSRLGLIFSPFMPALVQLRCKENYFKQAAGVRCRARIRVRAEGQTLIEEGELQFTDYGLSGIPVFQLSGKLVSYISRTGKTVKLEIDLLPDYSGEELTGFLTKSSGANPDYPARTMLTGLVNSRLADIILDSLGIEVSRTCRELTDRDLVMLSDSIKKLGATATGFNSFNAAQVCSGGISLSEINTHLETLKYNNLFICGELLDVYGRCGGYNLQWAWSSGYLAGKYAANSTTQAAGQS